MYGPREPLSDCLQDQMARQFRSEEQVHGATERDRRDVDVAIERLERTACQLRESIHALAARLVPVLQPEPTDPPPEAQGDQQELKCPLVQNLDAVRKVLLNSRTIADYLIDHLAL